MFFWVDPYTLNRRGRNWAPFQTTENYSLGFSKKKERTFRAPPPAPPRNATALAEGTKGLGMERNHDAEIWG